jgi:hypothetical protein
MGDFAASQIFLELNQFTIQTAQMPMTIYGLQHNVTIMRMLLFLTLQKVKRSALPNNYHPSVLLKNPILSRM